jgi:hypothetical protein
LCKVANKVDSNSVHLTNQSKVTQPKQRSINTKIESQVSPIPAQNRQTHFNSIQQKETLIMAVKSIKLGAIALLTSICGFATAPAFAQNAASVIQTSEQNATQVGNGNVSVQGNVQTGVVTQTGSPYYGIQCFAAPCPTAGINGASIIQSNEQNATQIGNGNTSIQGNAATANVFQGGSSYYPYYPSNINGAMVYQGNMQNAGQYGYGNSSAQGNAATAVVGQH